MLAAIICMAACKHNPEVETPLEEPTEAKGMVLKNIYAWLSLFNPADQQQAIELADELVWKLQNYQNEELLAHYQDSGLWYIAPIVWEADSVQQTWRYVGATNDGSTVLRFLRRNGKMGEAIITGHGEAINFTMNREIDGETRHIDCHIPEDLEILLREGNNALELTAHFDIATNSSYTIHTEILFGYTHWIADIRATTSNVSLAAGMTYHEKNMIDLTAAAPWSLTLKDDATTSEEYLLSLYANRIDLLKTMGKLEAQMQIGSDMRVQVTSPNVGKFYQAYEDWMFDNDKTSKDNLTLRQAQSFCKIHNSRCDITIFDQANDTLAQVITGAYEIAGKTGNERYSVESLLYFPYDQTKYTFTEFLTETRYGNLLFLVEQKANAYIRFLQYSQPEPLDLIPY